MRLSPRRRDGRRAMDAARPQGPRTRWLRRGARVALLLGFLATSGAGGGAADPAAAAERAERARLESDVRLLAADQMEGRGLSSEGLDAALRVVAARFQALGLKAPYPERASDEDPLAGYFQPFHAPGHPPSANVIGLLPGKQPSPPALLVIGAHVDHLGLAPRDEAAADGDRIYNGADDNASGVAALLEIARLLAQAPVEPGDRDVALIAFSGEESGLLGSKHYVAHALRPPPETIAMLNLDSVGRLRNDELIVFGTQTAREFEATLAGLNHAYGFTLALRGEGAGAADQASFFAADIPVLHFFTGPHEDYSRVSDEADRIDYDGLQRVTDYVGELGRYLRYRPRPLTFVAAGREQAEKLDAMAQRGQRRVSLGFMPDFSREKGGVAVGPVFPGAAAATAGLQTGDVIVAINDEPVDTLIDYTALLRQHAPGDTIEVVIHRGPATQHLRIGVQERR